MGHRPGGMMELICTNCDIPVGHGAIGVYKRPEDKDGAWLTDHCWSCGRSREEVREYNRSRGRPESGHPGDPVDPRGTEPLGIEFGPDGRVQYVDASDVREIR